MKDGRIAREGSIPDLLELLPGKMGVVVDSPGEIRVSGRAAELGWEAPRRSERS
jgi:hypothetical protein